ncbi:MAG: hypothetical protein NTY77_04030 [Elusimicrobia bacterium]|nr:hypothetical protein [Elusimicrobiota bacterium]
MADPLQSVLDQAGAAFVKGQPLDEERLKRLAQAQIAGLPMAFDRAGLAGDFEAKLKCAVLVQRTHPPMDQGSFGQLIRTAASGLGLDRPRTEAAVKLYGDRLRTLPPASPQDTIENMAAVQAILQRQSLDAKSRARVADFAGKLRGQLESGGKRDPGLLGGEGGVFAGGGKSPGSAAWNKGQMALPRAQLPANLRGAASAPLSLSDLLPPLRPDASGRIDVSRASHRLLSQCPTPDDALSNVTPARGVGNDSGASEATRREARKKLAGMLKVRDQDLSEESLRNMDHYLNAYGAVRFTVGASPWMEWTNARNPQEGDNWATRGTRRLGRMAVGLEVAGLSCGYEYYKFVDQTFGTNYGAVIGEDFKHNSSPASWRALGAKLSGTWSGIFNNSPDGPRKQMGD